MDRASQAQSVEEAKRRLLEESPVPPGLTDLANLVRKHPFAVLLVAAGVGALITRSAAIRSLIAPVASSILLKLATSTGDPADDATRNDISSGAP